MPWMMFLRSYHHPTCHQGAKSSPDHLDVVPLATLHKNLGVRSTCWGGNIVPFPPENHLCSPNHPSMLLLSPVVDWIISRILALDQNHAFHHHQVCFRKSNLELTVNLPTCSITWVTIRWMRNCNDPVFVLMLLILDVYGEMKCLGLKQQQSPILLWYNPCSSLDLDLVLVLVLV